MKALKKVPGKNKGLGKLSTAVRNKMGYMKKGGKVYQSGGKAPKGEIDLGSTPVAKYRLNLKETEELFDRVEKNWGRDESSVRTGVEAIDKRQDRAESDKRQARARAGAGYYDGDGGGAARRTKAYNDALTQRVLLKMEREKQVKGQEKRDNDKKEKALEVTSIINKSRANMKKGGKVVKYQKGGANPTPTERTMTGDERRITASPGNQPAASYKGYEKKKTPKEVLEGAEAKRLRMSLQSKYGPLRNESLGQLRKIAKTDGIYDKARGLAREDYQKEMDKRKG